MMKKFNSFAVLAAILTTGFTACTETEEIAKVNQKTLDFSVFANKTTRAAEDATSLKTDGKAFGVWGYSDNGAATTVFNNQEVTYSTANSAWEYSPTKYWDKEASYEFYAYYPYSASNVTIADGKISIADFTVASSVSDHVDLMIADKVARTAGSMTNVEFNFNHILSNINLNFTRGSKIGSTLLTLKSIKLYGMDNKASFSQTAETAPAGTWTLSTTNVIENTNATELVSADIELTTTSASASFPNMLFIPQGTDDLKLDIVYALGANEDQTFNRTIDLSANPTSWAQNQKITYKFTIDADAIVFDDPTVTDCDPKTDIGVPTIE